MTQNEFLLFVGIFILLAIIFNNNYKIVSRTKYDDDDYFIYDGDYFINEDDERIKRYNIPSTIKIKINDTWLQAEKEIGRGFRFNLQAFNESEIEFLESWWSQTSQSAQKSNFIKDLEFRTEPNKESGTLYNCQIVLLDHLKNNDSVVVCLLIFDYFIINQKQNENE